jgi:hypothetical protein
LSFHIGETFEEVAKNSTYPVMERSNRPADDPGENQFGATWVKEPAVIIHFNDPTHGFTLPPTKFAVLTYSGNQAMSLSTSPMLETMTFKEVLGVLRDIQDQFKASGWTPYKADDSEWFDLSPEGMQRINATMFAPPYLQQATLRVPGKYSMIFRLKCTEGCWTKEPPYRFLIDIGVGTDHYQ